MQWICVNALTRLCLQRRAREYPKANLLCTQEIFSCVKYYKEPGARRSGLFQDRSPAPADINSFCFPQARPFSAQAPRHWRNAPPAGHGFRQWQWLRPAKAARDIRWPGAGLWAGQSRRYGIRCSCSCYMMHPPCRKPFWRLAPGIFYRFPENFPGLHWANGKASSGISVRPGHGELFWAPGCCLARCSGEGPGDGRGICQGRRPPAKDPPRRDCESLCFPARAGWCRCRSQLQKSWPRAPGFWQARRRPRKHAGAGACSVLRKDAIPPLSTCWYMIQALRFWAYRPEGIVGARGFPLKKTWKLLCNMGEYGIFSQLCENEPQKVINDSSYSGGWKKKRGREKRFKEIWGSGAFDSSKGEIISGISTQASPLSGSGER